ncbi:MAG: YjfB family protein [Lachnospiraceae bacterium]|nr:YjfB family protein [Lachnospiraceae bacterium]
MDITTLPDIAGLSTAMAQSQLMSNVGTELLAEQLEQMQLSTDSLTKIMESSVQPHLGSTIDISL